MLVKAGKYVDVSGRCNVEYSQQWERKSEGCNLSTLLEALQDQFSQEPPVYAKPANIASSSRSPPVGDLRGRPQPPLPSSQPPTRPISPDRPILPPRPDVAPAYSSPGTHPQPVTSPTPPQASVNIHGALQDRPPPSLPPQYRNHYTAPPIPPRYAMSSDVNVPAPDPSRLQSPPNFQSSVSSTIEHGAFSYSPPPLPPPPAIPSKSYPSEHPIVQPVRAPIPNLLDEDSPDSLQNVAPAFVPLPPRPPNPELLRLHEQAHHKLTSELSSLSQALVVDSERLRAQQTDLLAGEPAIRDEMSRLEAVRDVCRNVAGRLKKSVDQAEANIAELRRKGDPETYNLGG
ncbi:hypothetical protein H0H92_002652 [Tricholoma furcatifolium]|nr:hypothetical protein H0H92_002652 [Tricholoma furcatifolium]